MRVVIGPTLLALTGCVSAPQTQEAAPGATVHSAHAKPAAMPAEPASHGLATLEAMTFDCPKAGLDAAARAASKVASQGSYQFSYYRLVNDAHHSVYEVHFTSNAAGEPKLRYCVSIYCQQGWDPRTTQIDVRLMTDEPARSGAQAQSACGASADAGKKPAP